MNNSIEKTGKTVEEAVELALSELDASEDDVEIEVLDEGNKGIFGIIGSKQARVRVTLKEKVKDIALDFLHDVFEKMGVEADITAFEEDKSLYIDINGNDSGIIIGRRGETLDAIQYLTSLVVNKTTQEYVRVVVDVENYRSKRRETLVELANKLADRVIKSKKNVTLEPMNPYERRVIHSTLQENKKVKTYSIGSEPNRKVVICLK